MSECLSNPSNIYTADGDRVYVFLDRVEALLKVRVRTGEDAVDTIVDVVRISPTKF